MDVAAVGALAVSLVSEICEQDDAEIFCRLTWDEPYGGGRGLHREIFFHSVDIEPLCITLRV
jgi:hypothetical protein